MTRYSVTRRGGPTKEQQQVHAVWRGIGCVLILIVPLMAWVVAQLTLQLLLRSGWPLPYQLLGYPTIPEAFWKATALWPVLGFIAQQPNLYMVLLLTVLWILVLSGLLSFGYSLVYRYVGPPRYGPLDVPQPEIKVGRYKR